MHLSMESPLNWEDAAVKTAPASTPQCQVGFETGWQRHRDSRDQSDCQVLQIRECPAQCGSVTFFFDLHWVEFFTLFIIKKKSPK